MSRVYSAEGRLHAPAGKGSLSRWVVWLLWLGLIGYLLLKPPHNFFAWDCFGYQLYLPATFIQHDPFLHNLNWVEAARLSHDASATLYQVGTLETGERMIRTPIGQAVLWVPWFFLGHIVAGITGAVQDGFSEPYQWSVATGVLLYLLLGLRALRQVLLNVVDERITSVVLVIIVLGTNLITQVRTDLTMPHLTLFALQCGVLYLTIKWHSERKPLQAGLLGALIGLATLVRPTEIICAIVPLLWGIGDDVAGHLRTLKKSWKQIACAALVTGGIGFVQLGYWWGATGDWVVDSYYNPSEGLDLLTPHTIDFLFSFRKGWLLYTPVMFFSLAGLFLLPVRFRRGAASLITLVITYGYLTSSWSCWWYADSFSSRPMVALYGALAVPLAVCIARLRDSKRAIGVPFMLLLTLCVPLNLFQIWQFEKGLIHSSRMTKPAYLATFGRTTKPEGFADLLLTYRSYTADQGEPDLTKYRKVDLPVALTTRIKSDVDTLITDATSGTQRTVYALGAGAQWTPAFHIPFRAITSKDHGWIRAEWYVLSPCARPKLTCAHCFENKVGNYGWYGVDLEKMELDIGRWDTVQTFYMTPEVRNEKDVLRLYFLLKDTTPLLVDGPVVTAYEPIK